MDTRNAETEFCEHVGAIVRRFAAQNGGAALDDARLRTMASRLWVVVGERGLPRPLEPQERGEPGSLPDDECAAIVSRVMDGWADPLVNESVRQLVKACFHPEFKTCRDSFREVSPDGSCRRQELGRVRRRVSGAHCVDCPYWVTLAPAQHAAFLRKNWRAGAADFDAHATIFLPEDFRAFRRWRHVAARAPLV